MTNSQLTAIRETAKTVTTEGAYSIISRRTGRVVMFGLTLARATEYAVHYGCWVKKDEAR